MSLPSAASAATGPNDPIERHRLRHAFEIVAAALLGNEQSCHLTLHPRCDHDRTGFGQGLCSGGDVRHVAVTSLAASITTGPMSMAVSPASAGLPLPSFLRFSSVNARWIASTARTARSASFSWATG
jgi:hypothetical protein